MADGATLGMDHILSADHGFGCRGPCPPEGALTACSSARSIVQKISRRLRGLRRLGCPSDKVFP